MEKHMEEVSVKTNEEGKILIVQDNPVGDHDDTIILEPDQVDVIIQWLQEAKAEIQKKST
jgi:hypothetical protein